MRIAVCLKRVPDTTTKIVIAPDGKSIDEAGVKFVPNPVRRVRHRGGAQAARRRRRRRDRGRAASGTDAAQETIRARARHGHRPGRAAAGDGGARRPRGGPRARRGAQGRRLRSDPLRQAGGRRLPPCRSARWWPSCSTCPASPRWRHSDDRGRDGRRRSARSRAASRSRPATLPAVLTCDKGLNTPRLPVAQGDHGRQEEAARGQAGDARRRAA